MSALDFRAIAYSLGREAHQKGENPNSASEDKRLCALIACCASFSREELEASWRNGWMARHSREETTP